MEGISVFYSSTDLPKYKKIFDAASQQVGELLDVHFEILHWREMAGGLADTAQDVIDRRVADNHQVYFGVMGHRFGKGTAGEYEKAVRSFIKKGKPNFVCFGFCETPVNPHDIDPESLTQLKQFRKDIGNPNKYGKAMLYFTFANEKTFQGHVERNLKEAIKVVKGRVAGGKRFGR